MFTGFLENLTQAAFNTTRNALALVLIDLAARPELQERCREEVRAAMRELDTTTITRFAVALTDTSFWHRTQYSLVMRIHVA